MDDGLGVQPGGQQHTRPRRRRPLPGQPGPYGWVGCPAYPVTPSPQRHLWCRGVGVGRARGATAGPRLVPPPRLFRPSPFQHRGRKRRAEGCRHTHLAGADARPCTPDDQPPYSAFPSRRGLPHPGRRVPRPATRPPPAGGCHHQVARAAARAGVRRQGRSDPTPAGRRGGYPRAAGRQWQQGGPHGGTHARSRDGRGRRAPLAAATDCRGNVGGTLPEQWR